MTDFEVIECEHEGVMMEAFLARPEGAGPHPTVMMFPGATGTGPTFESTARGLARNGYLALGIDVYGIEADLSTPEKAGEHFAALLADPVLLRARIVAWFESVATRRDVDEGRIAAIGYCFGGRCVLELARSGADVQAVVAYHGLLKTHAPARSGEVKAEVVAYCAGKDPYAPMEDFDAFRAEMEAAGVRHQLTVFSEAEHSFTDPDHAGIQPGIAYDPMAHRVSWAGTLALLDYRLNP